MWLSDSAATPSRQTPLCSGRPAGPAAGRRPRSRRPPIPASVVRRRDKAERWSGWIPPCATGYRLSELDGSSDPSPVHAPRIFGGYHAPLATYPLRIIGRPHRRASRNWPARRQNCVVPAGASARIVVMISVILIDPFNRILILHRAASTRAWRRGPSSIW